MTDQVLDILKLGLLGLLYLFFARVLWAVWSEVRSPASARQTVDSLPPGPHATTQPAPGKRTPRPARGKKGTPARLVVLEPKERRGAAFAIGPVITLGREDDNTVRIDGDSYVSGHHARVSMSDGSVVVDDLDSRNGTFLNGTRLTQRRIVHPGDRIQVGYTVLEAQ